MRIGGSQANNGAKRQSGKRKPRKLAKHIVSYPKNFVVTECRTQIIDNFNELLVARSIPDTMKLVAAGINLALEQYCIR